MKKSMTFFYASFLALAFCTDVQGAHLLQRTCALTTAVSRARVMSSTSFQAVAAHFAQPTNTSQEDIELPFEHYQQFFEQDLKKDQPGIQQEARPLFNKPSLKTIPSSNVELSFAATLTKSIRDLVEIRKNNLELKRKELADRKLLAQEYNIKQVKKENKALKGEQKSWAQTFNQWLADRQKERAQERDHKQKLQHQKETVDLKTALKTIEAYDKAAKKKLELSKEAEETVRRSLQDAQKLLKTISQEKTSTLDLIKGASQTFKETQALQEQRYKESQTLQEEKYQKLADRYTQLEGTMKKDTQKNLKKSNITIAVVGTAVIYAVATNWEELVHIHFPA